MTYWPEIKNKDNSLKNAQTVLEISGKKQLGDPTDHQIRAELELFDARTARNDEAFASLSRASDMTYIQICGHKSVGFYLEYQDGDIKHHYRAVKENYTLDEIVSILCAYRDGNQEWKNSLEWEQMKL